jgi:acyl carrier protein
MATTAETLKNILTERFSMPEEKIQPEATLDSLGLDSLDLIEVLFEVEEAFDIRVPQDGATVKAATIQELLDTITRLVEQPQPAATQTESA